MTQREFPDRSQAFAYLREECPLELRHVFDDDDGVSLLELFFEGLTSEPLLSKSSTGKIESRGTSGYSAYIQEYGIIVNLKKGALLSAVLLVDVLLTQGVASLILTQVMRDPVFIRRLSSAQHLMCILNHEKWANLSYDEFKCTLNGSQCKNPDFECKYQGTMGLCLISQRDLDDSVRNLENFFSVK